MAAKITEEFWKKQKNKDFSGEIRAKELLKASKRYLKGKVLDVGAGSGALIRRIPDSAGIDLVARPEVNVKKGSVTNLDFEDNSFDTVFATEILEHLSDKDLRKATEELYRVLKPKGYLIVTTPYKENLEKARVRCPHCKKKFHPKLHLQSFDEDLMKAALRRFNIVKISREIFGFSHYHPILGLFKPLVKRVKKDKVLFAVAKK